MTTGLSLYLDRFPQDSVPHLSLQENGIGDLANSRPSVIKIMNNTSYCAWLRQNYPNILVIARDFGREEQFQSEVTLGTTPAKSMASLWFNIFRPAIVAAGNGVYWEVAFNEPEKTPAKLKALAEFYLAVMELGVPIVLYNVSAEFNFWDIENQVENRVKESLDKAEKLGYILGLHAYQSPTLKENMKSDFLFPNRKIQSKVKKVITEMGIDTIFSENKHYDGWRTTGLSAEQYANQLIAVDKEYRKDPTVLGECVYISGRNTNDDDKTNYYTSFRQSNKGGQPPDPCVDDYIVAYNMANLNVQMPSYPPIITPPPVPTPTPTPTVGNYTTVSSYNLRSQPVVDKSNLITTLPAGKSVLVEKIENGWAKITAYISEAGLKQR